MVLKIDWFGNIVTNFSAEQFAWVAEQPFQLRAGSGAVRRFCANYASAQSEEPFVIAGSGGYLEISANEGNAAKVLGVSLGASVQLSPLTEPRP